LFFRRRCKIPAYEATRSAQPRQDKESILFYISAKKPFPKGIRQCLAQYGKEPQQCAIAGDQIFTDTLGGNCAGLTSILVRPINNHNFWLKARHVLEKPFIFMARNRRI
jgi:predicted HAD superfamily phosphohydrolase YqeG